MCPGLEEEEPLDVADKEAYHREDNAHHTTGLRDCIEHCIHFPSSGLNEGVKVEVQEDVLRIGLRRLRHLIFL
jgi:hypothetical protein